jgi:hypothetical protein
MVMAVFADIKLDSFTEAPVAMTNVLLYGSLAAAAVAALVRRDVLSVALFSLLGMGVFGWWIFGPLLVIDYRAADASIETETWIGVVGSTLAAVAAAGITVAPAGVRERTWGLAGASSSPAGFVAAGAGALLFGSMFLPYIGEFSTWEYWWTGVVDVLTAVLAGATVALGLLVGLTRQRGVTWGLAIVSIAAFFFIFTPGDIGELDIKIGWILGLLAVAVALAASMWALWEAQRSGGEAGRRAAGAG